MLASGEAVYEHMDNIFGRLIIFISRFLHYKSARGTCKKT